MRSRAIALLATVALGAGLGACGDDDESGSAGNEPATVATPAPEPAPPATGTTSSSGSSSTNLKISTDTSKKPEIPKPSGDPPTELVTKDVVVGKGRAAASGDTVVMNYVGVLFKNGEQFDASWDRGKPLDAFPLGQGNVIAGWDQGLVGMKVGGRRLLVIPPDLAYGAQGQGSIGPDETLVFVVDMLNATPA